MNKRTTTAKPPRRVKAAAVTDTSWGPSWPPIRRWELPRTAIAYDAMVEQMVQAIFRADDEPHWNRANLHAYYKKHAIAALRAIGIRRPKEDKP